MVTPVEDSFQDGGRKTERNHDANIVAVVKKNNAMERIAISRSSSKNIVMLVNMLRMTYYVRKRQRKAIKQNRKYSERRTYCLRIYAIKEDGLFEESKNIQRTNHN